MKIAYFSEVFLPKIDGVVNTLLRLFEYLANNHHESILFVPHSSITAASSTAIVTTQSIPLLIYPDVFFSMPSTTKFRRQLEEFQPDLVHIINPVHFDLPGLTAARQLNIPVVASYQTDFPGYAKTLGLGFMEKPIWQFFRKIHNQADLNLAPSNITRCQMIRNGIERVKVWRRGIDLTKFSPQNRNTEMRRYLSDGDTEKPLLLYVGRLSPEKRVDWLRQIFDEGLDARLAFVGDGPYRPILEQVFSDTPTVFTGFLQGDQLQQAYASADIFIFPSKNETLGNVVLEAMASGLPVIAPDEGGHLDHVVNHTTGLLFEADSPGSMIAAVKDLMDDQQKREQMGAEAINHLNVISWQSIFDQLMDDYRQTITNHPYSRRMPLNRPDSKGRPFRMPEGDSWRI